MKQLLGMRWVFAATLCTLLAGCGVKGALYVPEKKEEIHTNTIHIQDEKMEKGEE